MKVLIVDDDPDVRTFLVSCIETMNCESIDVAENGEEALARSVQSKYDLVTLDLKMPGVSGMDILSVIRGMMPWAVIVIISGYTEDMPEGAEEYTDLVLSKPVRVQTLQSVVQISRELSQKRESLKELAEEQ
jgi:two-component system response regulator ResD